jgi:hypothetical protein
MRNKLRVGMLIHGVALLLIAALPFVLGAYRSGAALLTLLLLIWPLVCFLSPFALARSGMKWYFALAPTPVFFIMPLCVLLTPAGLAYLGAYPVLYALTALIGAGLGAWRHARRQARSRSLTL